MTDHLDINEIAMIFGLEKLNNNDMKIFTMTVNLYNIVL